MVYNNYFHKKQIPALSCCGLLKRLTLLAQNTMGFCFSWGFLYASKWEVARRWPSLGEGNPNSIVSRVVLSMFLSFSAFLIILCLDKLADLDCTGTDVDLAIFTIIQSIGILV